MRKDAAQHVIGRFDETRNLLDIECSVIPSVIARNLGGPGLIEKPRSLAGTLWMTRGGRMNAPISVMRPGKATASLANAEMREHPAKHIVRGHAAQNAT
jgi:hypothetical protein